MAGFEVTTEDGLPGIFETRLAGLPTAYFQFAVLIVALKISI